MNAEGYYDQEEFEAGWDDAQGSRDIDYRERVADLHQDIEMEEEDEAREAGLADGWNEVEDGLVAEDQDREDGAFESGCLALAHVLGRDLTAEEVRVIDRAIPEGSDPNEIVRIGWKGLQRSLSPEAHKRARQVYAQGLWRHSVGGSQQTYDPYQPSSFQHRNASGMATPGIRDARPNRKSQRFGR